jgi:hypothetical protein
VETIGSSAVVVSTAGDARSVPAFGRGTRRSTVQPDEVIRTRRVALQRNKPTTNAPFPAIGVAAVVEVWLELKKAICDPYRPELHYMRGPGPRWREKHSRAGR